MFVPVCREQVQEFVDNKTNSIYVWVLQTKNDNQSPDVKNVECREGTEREPIAIGEASGINCTQIEQYWWKCSE